MPHVDPNSPPPGSGEIADPLDWAQWYDEVLDGLLAAIESANIDWGLDPDGEPYIIAGQQRPSGVEYPLAMILSFRKVRDSENSDRHDELHDIETSVTVFDRADPTDHRENLRQTQRQMGAIESALYADRSLGGVAEYLVVTESTAFELETERGDETAGDIQLTVQKPAHHAH